MADPEGRSPAPAGRLLLAGQAVEVDGRAAVEFPDGTRLEFEDGGTIRDLEDLRGKGIFMARGALRAVVVRQAAGRPAVFRTPHGDATVPGTSFRLEVKEDRTFLEVGEGRVRLPNLAGKAADVLAGHFAVAAAGVEPSALARPAA